MASLFQWFWRTCARFWANRSEGVFGWFVKSAPFIPVMVAVWWAAMFAVAEVVNIRSAAGAGTIETIFWFAVLPAAVILPVLAIFSRGAAVRSSATHLEGAAVLLERCTSMLEARGLHVRHRDGATLYASRGRFWKMSLVPSELEWRSFPVEVVVGASASGPAIELHVEVIIGTVTSGPGRGAICEITLDASRAVANLDEYSLARLERLVPIRQKHFFLGGLANTVFNAMFISALVGVGIVTGLFVLALPRLLDFATSVPVIDATNERWVHVLDSIDAPERMELERYLSGQMSTDGKASDVLAGFHSVNGEDNLVIALRKTDGSYSVVLPGEGAPLRPLAEAIAVAGATDAPQEVQRVGDRVFQRFAPFRVREFERRLGLERNRLVAGILVTYEDIAVRAARHPNWTGSEATFFCRGNSVVHLRWSGGKVIAQAGAANVPQEVLRSAMEESGFEVSWANILRRPHWVDTLLRQEERADNTYRVTYLGEMSPDGWCGFALAQPIGWQDMTGYMFYSTAVAVAVFGFILTYFLALTYSTVVAGRISRPIVELRDKLSLISRGDYSAHIASDRKDEIGQLQNLLNETAVELRKRESIRELMGKYLSKQVADRIMADDSSTMLTGSRREVSVLFADVRGFTSYSEKHPPEEVTRSLNEYFEVMVDVIAAHEGVLDKFIGDGLMVVFGAPVAQSDHERRAVDTALEMQAALQSLNLKRAQRGDDPIAIGIGINSGIAISGNLGSLKRMEFTVVGDTVNTAARLESSARQGQILIGRATYEKVKDIIESEPLGQIAVKGKADPVEIWWLKGLKPRRV